MTYEVFARRWRPQTFQDVIGQEHVSTTLMNAIRNDRLAHAYLFSGARGVGKTSVARILAKAINCREGEPGTPCNKCVSCQEITSGSSMDVQEIDGASNRGIDEIRELRENIKYMPSSSRFRVYIIDEVHMLTKEAFNALLKSLEEPPPHVKFVFATTEPHKVPVTILSRCQRFDFKRIPLQKVVGQLEKITAQEGIEISRSGLTIIAREAEGSMRDAESLLDQVVSFTGSRIEDHQITEILGIVDRDLLFRISLSVIEGRADRCIELVDKIYNFGYDIKAFYRALMDQFRNLLVALVAPGQDLLDMTESDVQEVKRQAELAGEERLRQALNLLIAREEDLRHTLHPRLVLENILIRLCRLGEMLSFDELIRKIEGLEKRLIGGGCPGNLSDPGIPWDAGEDGQAVVETVKQADRTWEGFLEYLSSKSRALGNVLRGWSCVSLTAEALEIAKAGNSFSSSYLDDKETWSKFLEYSGEYFERDLKVRIVDGPKVNRKASVPEKTAGAGERKEIPEAVQEVLQVFKGKVKEEIPLKGKR